MFYSFKISSTTTNQNKINKNEKINIKFEQVVRIGAYVNLLTTTNN